MKGRPSGIYNHQPSMPAGVKQHTEESFHLNEEFLKALLHLIELTGVTDKELIDHSLEEVIRLTGSRIGYLHFVTDDQEHNEMFTWSKDVLKVCNADKVAHFPLNQASVWADCLRARKPVICNGYQNPSDGTGYTERHTHIVRHMSIPITDDKEIVAIAGVMNREEPYDQFDVDLVSFYMSCMWCILKRKRMQEKNEQLASELQGSLAGLRTLSGILPICSNCKSIRDDQGSWNRLESYLLEHTDAELTHGICPTCAKQLYPDVDLDR